MRIKKLFWNTSLSLFYRIIAIICGFVLPQLILRRFGSEINGLVNSITQFLQIISFLELGVGAVVESSLYRPLAENHSEQISKIVASANNFFHKLAKILIVYVIVLTVIYPYITEQSFSPLYIAVLILSISISTFAQYYFGIVDGLLLIADQRSYIRCILQILTVLVNTITCVILINFGQSIHTVKLISSMVFLILPIAQRIYVNKHYKINRKIKYDVEPIEQKWNGVAQHVAAVVLDGTDNVVISVFSTLSNVSIYSVYHLVIYGVKQLFGSLTGGIQAVLGELWAKKEQETLYKTFSRVEWSIHTCATLIFGCTGMLILPFVQVYTAGVNDANYSQPLFAVLITIANAMHCLRYPYNLMILAAGHYKQTQYNYVIAAFINILISIVGVIEWGLIGVAIGTVVAMMFQTVWMAYYNSKNLLKWPFSNFVKQLLVDVMIIIVSVIFTNNFSMRECNYIAWIILAVKVSLVWIIVSLFVNMMFYRNKVIKICTKILGKSCKYIPF